MLYWIVGFIFLFVKLAVVFVAITIWALLVTNNVIGEALS